jgi:phosphate-selective porin OprO/OprP
MDCQKPKSFLFRGLAAGFLLLLCGRSGPLLGQESDLSLETLLERIERLEADNKRLQQKVGPIESEDAETADSGDAESDVEQTSFSGSSSKHPKGWLYESTTPETLFAGGTSTPLLNETYVRHIVTEEIIQRDQQVMTSHSGEDQSADALQDQRIASLDNAFKSFQEKANKKTYPSVSVNGVFQSDAGWIHQDSNSETQYGQIQDGANFRRARLSAKGSVTELTNYFFQMDFGFFGRPTFTDVWLEQTKVPLFGNVRIGQWKQPFGLETVSSFRYTTFMERSVLFQPFTPFRHIGIGFYDHSDDLSNTWAASVFRSGQDQFGGTLSSDGGYGMAERLT